MNQATLKYFLKVEELRKTQTAFVTVTLVHAKGQVPQEISSKMLVTREGRVEGTVGGGKIEMRSIQFAQELLAGAGAAILKTWNLQTDIGMSCGGEVSLFFEPAFSRNWSIFIFGAGHVAQALSRILITLDCSTTFIDSRAEWLERLPESPRLKKVLHPSPPELVQQIPLNAQILSMTQGHGFDLPILKTLLLNRSPIFVGAIGSETKARKLKKDLREAGVLAQRIELLHCPVGLPLGDNSPEEIAISVTAQLIQERDRTNCDRYVPSFHGAAETGTVSLDAPVV